MSSPTTETAVHERILLIESPEKFKRRRINLGKEELSKKYYKMKEAKAELDEARQYLHRCEKRYWQAKKDYELVDRELAFQDGRHQVLKPTGEPKNRKKKGNGKSQEELTKEQLQEVAKKLGINLNLEG